MPLYHVTDGLASHLVNAKSAAQAIRHVVADRYSADVPSALEAASMAARGVPIEQAGDEPEPATAQTIVRLPEADGTYSVAVQEAAE